MPVDTRNLVLYLGARLAGTVGIQVQSVAIAWEVYARTGEPLDLAWVGLAQFLPLALLSLWAGNLADRLDRRLILTVCRVTYALGSLALAWFALHPEHGLWPIFSVLVLLGATRAFAAPAGWALLPWLVGQDRLPRAIAMSSTTFQLATIGGPMLGGLLVAAGGPAVAYGTAAGLEAIAALLVVLLRFTAPERKAPEEKGLALLFSGVRYVWRAKILLGAISLDLFAVLLGGAVALMPIYARDILEVGATGFGWLRAAPAAGAIAVALVLAYRPIGRHAGRWMFAGVAVFGLSTIVFGLSESFPLSLVALALLGAADMVSVVIRQSLVQIWTPDEMRGRVGSVSMIFIGASNELGEFESGVTAQWLGAVRAVVLGGVGTLIVVALWLRLFPRLRDVDRLEDA
ncbi:MAG: MFS transporter [Myxococcota bacterium]|nr:MFS transporter [Myxococcota bacterium]